MTNYRRTYKHAVSVSAAIERIFEYQPQHYSLPDILQFTVEQAERDYRNALADPDRQAEIADLTKELESTEQERDLARDMHIELNTAADKLKQGGTHDYLVPSVRPWYGPEPYFTKASLYEWAKECHGKVIPEWASVSTPTATQVGTLPQTPDKTAPDRDWTSVKIRLLPNYFISYSIRGGGWVTKPLSETGFVDKRKSEVTLNKSFEILAKLAEVTAIAKRAGHPDTIGFAAGKKRVNVGVRAQKSKLCNALKDLVGLEGNPFSDRSHSEGYKPHFTVEDKRHESMPDEEWNTNKETHNPENGRHGATQHSAHGADDEDNNDDDDDDDNGYGGHQDESNTGGHEEDGHGQFYGDDYESDY